MLKISDTLKNDLTSFDIIPYVLVKIGFSTPLLYTDAPFSITYNSETYVTGPILSVSPPNSQGQINRDIFEITLDDPGYTIEQMITSDTTGVDVDIQLNLGDEFLPVYNGKTSHFSSSIREGRLGIQNALTINCTGPLTKLYQISNRTTTEASQKEEHASDTCFDFSFDSENEATLKWGGLS